jgi:tetratricopeptide (TPR) repeat protein
MKPSEKWDRPPVQGFFEQVHQRYEILKDLGDAYVQMGEGDRAMDAYHEAAVLEPSLPQAHTGMGMLLLQVGRLDQAKIALDRAVRVDPCHAEACAGLAIYYQRREQFPRAFEMYLRSLELDPYNLLALLGLFQTSSKMGAFAKITHYLEGYLQKYPDDTSVMFCLASIHAREGRLIEARNVLFQVLAIDPDKAEAVELLDKVQAYMERTETDNADQTRKVAKAS